MSRAKQGGGREGEAGFYESVKAYEIFLIRRALLKAYGNQSQAARLLRLKPTTLHSKMKAYNIKADPTATEPDPGVAQASRTGPRPQSRGAS